MHILFGTFPGIIYLNSSQNLLAFFCLLSMKLIGTNLHNFAPNKRSSTQLVEANIKCANVIVSGRRIQLIVYYVLSYHILESFCLLTF